MQLASIREFRNGLSGYTRTGQFVLVLNHGKMVGCFLPLRRSHHVPVELKNPREISSGYAHACALTDDGVKCWGYQAAGKMKAPVGLRNPRSIVGGGEHACALTDDGVKCWGDSFFWQTIVPVLKNPREITAGAYHSCALTDDGVQCWGLDEYGPIPAGLKNPRGLTSGGGGSEHTCALTDDGVRCWGWNRYGQTNVPDIEW